MGTSEPVANQTGAVTSKAGPLLGTIAAWILPLMALCLMVGSLGMAVRAGQMLWMNAGIITYVVCIAMWAVIGIRKLTTKAAIPASDSTTAAPEPATGKMAGASGGSASFNRFANWFLPFIGLVALAAANLLAALTNQQKWLTAGILSFVGSVLVWISTLFIPVLLLPLLGQNAFAQNSYQEPQPLRPAGYIAQLLLSLLCLSTALTYAENAAHVRWLVFAIGCFVLYLLVVSVQAIAFHQDGVALRWTVIPGIGLGLLILGLGWAIDLYRVNWMLATIVGVCGCVTVWMAPAMASASKSYSSDGPQPNVPSRMPALSILGLLIALGLAFYGRQMSALQAVLLALFGGLAVWFSWMVIAAVERDGAPQVESNWGGIGGGMGGWRCSPSIVYAICTLVFALCAAFCLLGGAASSSSADAPSKTLSEKTLEPPSTQHPASGSKTTPSQPEQAATANATQPASAPPLPSLPAPAEVKDKK